MSPDLPTPDPQPVGNAFRRYIILFFATLVSVVGVVWIYVATVPIAFMESGYAAWTAKADMLRECQLGEVAFIGDSRLEAGVVPAAFPRPATNFGFAGGSAVEIRVAVDRALACPTLPRQAVLTVAPEHFGPLSEFYWLLSLRFGFLTLADAIVIRSQADALGDTASLATPTPDRLGGPVRDWLYATHFPSLSFASLVRGRIAGRLALNRARLADIRQSRGWAPYENGAEHPPVHVDRFIVTPLQAAELDAAIAALRGRGVAVALLMMPFADTHPEPGPVLDAYRDHLAAVARRTGATLLDPAVPIWPASFFADGTHLAPAGARAFTAALATCLRDGLLQPPCALDPPGPPGPTGTTGP